MVIPTPRPNRFFSELVAKNVSEVLTEASKYQSEDSTWGALARGKIFEVTGNAEWAIQSYEEAVTRDHESLEALARLTIARLQARHYEDALSSAVELASRDCAFIVRSLVMGEEYSPMSLLGDAMLLNERVDEAVEAYRKALEINPNDSFSAGRLAQLHLAKGETQEAIKLAPTIGDSLRYQGLRSVLTLASNNPSCLPAIDIKTTISLMVDRPVGRPLMVDGELRRAALVDDDVWCANVTVIDTDLPREERLRAAKAWIEAGRDEHASIAAFARFVLQLLGLGAPPELVIGAIRAMADEMEHARESFGVGRALANKPASLGEMDLSGVLAGNNDPRSILKGSILEGCIGETISALYAAAARDRTEIPSIKAILDRIATDESNHASLAWRFVDWMLYKHPEMADELEIVFAAESSCSDIGIEAVKECAASEHFGLLSERSKRRITQQAFREIIWPKAVQLIARSKGTESLDRVDKPLLVG